MRLPLFSIAFPLVNRERYFPPMKQQKDTNPSLLSINHQILLLCIIGLCLSTGSLMVAYFFMEKYLELIPCPLCILDRVVVFLSACLFFLPCLHHPRRMGYLAYTCTNVGVNTLGTLISARHVWLQSLPADKVPQCTPDLGYLLDTFPPFEALRTVFQSSGECAEVSWSLWGLSLAQLTLLYFVFMVCYCLFTATRIASFPKKGLSKDCSAA